MSTPQQESLLKELKTDLQTGLTSDEALNRREEDGCFNVVRPPVDCPGWLCILLPCIKHIPSMKAFAPLKPDDAEVRRESKWVRYDAASLVRGDIIRLEEGDTVPADCIVLNVEGESNELLVDVRSVVGDDQLRSCTGTDPVKLYLGSTVVQGSATAVVNAIGPNTLLAKLIREKRFPPKEPVLEDEVGIAMTSLS